MKVTFITLTNSGYLNFTRNCLESLRRIGFESYLHCYCLDPRCYEELSKEHDLVHMVKDNSEIIHDLQDFRVGQWAHVTFNKFRIISENLNKYDYVVFTDGDIVFESMEFIRYLESNIGDNDILIQNDSLSDVIEPQPIENICSGFMFIRSNQVTRRLFDPAEVGEANKNIEGWDDQIYINQIKSNLKYQKLPLTLFPTGDYYYQNASILKPYMIHFNWIPVREKVSRMKSYRKWYL